MLGVKKDTPNVQQSVSKSIDFEVTIADMARRSERRAWWVALSAISMALILALGYFFLLPLKQKVPYLVMADAYTGTSTVARLTDGVANQRISSSEALARSNVAHFVLARESYDVTLINLRDWTTVMTMSAPEVAMAYQNLYSQLNPDNPYKVYGANRAIRINILSIVLIGGSDGQPYKGATVRFQRTLYDKQSGATQPLDNEIATLAFTYKPNLQMAEKYRIENPLGFQVTSYRVDTDYATTPPPSTAAPEQTGDADATTQTASPDPAGTPVANGNSATPMTNLSTSPVPEHDASVPGDSTPALPQTNAAGASRR